MLRCVHSQRRFISAHVSGVRSVSLPDPCCRVSQWDQLQWGICGGSGGAADRAGEGAARVAGAEIVVEDFLEGEEASFFALVDGETCVALASAQDHKAVGEGDTGAAPVHHVLLTCPLFFPEIRVLQRILDYTNFHQSTLS